MGLIQVVSILLAKLSKTEPLWEGWSGAMEICFDSLRNASHAE